MDMKFSDKKTEADVPPSYDDCLLQQPSAPQQQNVLNYAGNEHNVGTPRTINLIEPSNELLPTDIKKLTCAKDGNSFTFWDASIDQHAPLFKVTYDNGCLSGTSAFNVQSLTGDCTDLLVKSTGSNICRSKTYTVTKKNLDKNVVAVIKILTAYVSQRRNISYDVQEVVNSSGQEIFKLEMQCGLQRGFSTAEMIYEVTARSQKIGTIKQLLNTCGESKYTFEYTLPLDVPTLSILMCCILTLDDCYRSRKRSMLTFLLGFLAFNFIIFFVIMGGMSYGFD